MIIKCPSCLGKYVSAIVYWRPNLNKREFIIDIYSCESCGALIDPVTRGVLYEYNIPIENNTNKQISLFGDKNTEVDDEMFVWEKWRPKIIRASDGDWFGGGYIFSIDDRIYYPILQKMLSELYDFSRHLNTNKKTSWKRRNNVQKKGS